MLDDYPVLKDRLKALAVFSGIAIAAVSGFDMIITGGFDFAMPGRDIRQVAPSAYVTVVDAPWRSQTTYVALSSTEPMFAGEEQAYTGEELAGSYDDAPQGRYPAQSEEDIYREIEALYQDQEDEAAVAVDYEDYAAGEVADYSAPVNYQQASLDPKGQSVSAY